MTSVVASVIEKNMAMSHEANGDLGNGWLKTNSASSGAFKLVSWKANESVTLEAYPGFPYGSSENQASGPAPHSRGWYAAPPA